MKRRLFRIIVRGLTVPSLLLFIATCVLWVRSYWQADLIEGTVFRMTGGREVHLYSSKGGLRCRVGVEERTWDLPTELSRSEKEALDRFNRPLRLEWTCAEPSGYPLVGHDRDAPRSLFGCNQERIEVSWRISRDNLEIYGYKKEDYWDELTCVFPHAAVVAAASPLPLSWLIRRHRQNQRARKGHCTTCGYDLRATSGRCPECGAVPAAKAIA